MFKNVEIKGDVASSEQFTVTEGKFKRITLQCDGETITMEGKIKKIMRSGGVSNVVAVEINEPGKATYQVNSLSSDALKNADGSPRVEPEGTTYRPVPGGKAYVV